MALKIDVYRYQCGRRGLQLLRIVQIGDKQDPVLEADLEDDHVVDGRNAQQKRHGLQHGTLDLIVACVWGQNKQEGRMGI